MDGTFALWLKVVSTKTTKFNFWATIELKTMKVLPLEISYAYGMHFIV